jgi:hypothetical protein
MERSRHFPEWQRKIQWARKVEADEARYLAGSRRERCCLGVVFVAMATFLSSYIAGGCVGIWLFAQKPLDCELLQRSGLILASFWLVGFAALTCFAVFVYRTQRDGGSSRALCALWLAVIICLCATPGMTGSLIPSWVYLFGHCALAPALQQQVTDLTEFVVPIKQ